MIKNPKISRIVFIIKIKLPADKFSEMAPKITEIPLTPPVEKLFGSLKKYIPAVVSKVPIVIIKKIFIFSFKLNTTIPSIFIIINLYLQYVKHFLCDI